MHHYMRTMMLGAWMVAMAAMPAHAQEQAKLVANVEDDANVVRGLVTARNEAVIASPTNAKVSSLPFKPGMKVKKHATIVRFDCDRVLAEQDHAKAALKAATSSFESAAKLQRLGSIGELEYIEAESDFFKAKADVAVRDKEVRNCTITAPYPALVETIMVNTHENVSAGQELLRIHDPSSLEISLIAPSEWLAWLKEGTSFKFLLDETEEWLDATIERLPSYVDANSQTIQLTGTIKSKPQKLIKGMSGSAVFTP